MQTRNPNRKLNALLVVAAIAALGMGAAALAQDPGSRGAGPRNGRGSGGFAPGPERVLEHLQARLDLDDDQVAAITELHEKNQATNMDLRKDAMRLQNEKRGELLKDEPDAGKVIDLTRRIGAVRTEMRTNRVEMRLAVRKLLTPEQRDKMLMAGERGGNHERGGRGGRDGHAGRGRRAGCGEHGGGCQRGPGQRGGQW